MSANYYATACLFGALVLGACSSSSAPGEAAPPPPPPPAGGDEAGTPLTPDAPPPPDAGPESSIPGADGGCTAAAFYADADGDKYGDPAKQVMACVAPAGYVVDRSDCDDRRADVHPGATEVCDLLDSNCDGMVNGNAADTAACAAAGGSYGGTYSIRSEEKLGASVIHSMNCTGTSAFTVDLARPTVLSGTLACAFPGSLGGFAAKQTATIEGRILPSGKVDGTIKHTFFVDPFDGPTTRAFRFAGSLGAGGLVINDTSNTWLPHPMSAVPWTVELRVNATK